MPVGDTLDRIRDNWHSGALDSLISAVATGLSSADFADLPVVSAPEHLVLILDKDEEYGDPEIVWVTLHSVGSTTLTVLRAQEGTIAREHVISTKWVHGLTAYDLDDTVALIEQNITDISDHEAVYLAFRTDEYDPHVADLDLHHSKYLDQDARDTIAAQDVYLLNTTDTLAGELTVTASVTVGGVVKTTQVRPDTPTGDLTFEDGSGVDLMRFDFSVDEWEFEKTVDMQNNILGNPKDPASGSHVGDRNYNDNRYALDSHSHSYLPLSGGTLTGALTLPAGTNTSTELRFLGMSANDGMYGLADKVHFAFNGFRSFSLGGDTADNHVEIRGSTKVPLYITRQGALGDEAIVLRTKMPNSTEVTITQAALRWLATEHNAG